MKELARIVGNSEEDACAPWLAAEIRKTYQKYFGGTGGYEKEKKEFNQILLDVEKDLEQKILNSEDSLRTALLYARVGNYIDFSALECVDKEELMQANTETSAGKCSRLKKWYTYWITAGKSYWISWSYGC